MANIYSSAELLIGHTPLLELGHLEKLWNTRARVLAKLESLNPSGSAKDRAAKYMLDDAEKRGLITAGATVIEPTSGNTGIGLCAVAVQRGYKAVIVMPDTMSIERIRLMRAYGAEIVLTPGSEGMAGAIQKAEVLHAATPNSFIPGQFVNPANALAHYETTGPEIWEDTDGKVDYFIAGVGTGGTVTGVGRYLKEQNPDVKIVAVEPADSALLTGGKAGAHGIQGIGANFIPEVLDRTVPDEVIDVKLQDAYETGRLMGTREGVLCGISAGAALWAAKVLAQRPESAGKTIVVLLPDGGDRYLSTPMYAEAET